MARTMARNLTTTCISHLIMHIPTITTIIITRITITTTRTLKT
ncbi:MAG: hypothetical protein ACOX19_07795 [Fermentimonas sp.]